jgi:hypothetical protein
MLEELMRHIVAAMARPAQSGTPVYQSHPVQRLARPAHVAPVQDQPVVRVHQALGRHALHKVRLHRVAMLAQHLQNVQTSAICEQFKVQGKSGIIRLAGGFSDSALFDVSGLRKTMNEALDPVRRLWDERAQAMGAALD